MTDLDNRRPLKVRDTGWARDLATQLARSHATPDLISALGVVIAALGAAILALAGVLPPVPRAVLLVIAAAAIQGRLMCNLLDGMVAVEHGRGSSDGPIWNELPDRFSDAFLLAGAGFMLAGLGWRIGASLGWIAAILAILTAYVRELGRGFGLPADFTGPMAKQQRMAALTGGCLLSAIEPLWNGGGQMMLVVMALIVVGTAWTIARRVAHLSAGLKANKAD
jgi:phosphatidylglycerophosphate synthase